MKVEQLEDIVCCRCRCEEACSLLPLNPRCRAFDALFELCRKNEIANQVVEGLKE